MSISNIKRIIIFGHTGFIGKHLEEFFKNKYPKLEVIGKSFPSIDLTKEDDVISLKEIFDIKTAIIMCSALKKEHGDNIDNFYKNTKMVLNLSKVIESYPVGRFIYFSSAAVYGEDIHNTNISEDTIIQPTSYYGIAKYTCERLLSKVMEGEGKKTLVILRPPVIYGPNDEPCYGPSGFVKAALNKEVINLWGDGKEKREFIYVGDIVKIVNELIFHSYSGVLNVASGKSYTFIDVLNIISSLINRKLEYNSKERTKDKVDNGFCNKFLLSVFPNFSFTSLNEGIKKIIENNIKQKLE